MLSTCRSLVAVLVVAAAVPSKASKRPHISRGDVPIERGFAREVVVDGLEHPWGMAWLPSGDLLVTERPGRLRWVKMSKGDEATLSPKPIAGVPPVYARGQGGLLDIAVHPQFEKNRWVYISYAHGTRGANRTRVARAVLDRDRLRDVRVLFETEVAKSGAAHFGSRLRWLPDGTLLVSVGDGGNPPVRLAGKYIREYAQDNSVALGTLVRLAADGSIPPDNPLAGPGEAGRKIFSYGHRNIQGLVYDPLRKTIWATEHGALGGDELNRVEAGKNYGWPLVTHSREYTDGSKISPHVSQPGMVDPAVVWESAIAPSGLTLYTGDAFPQWKGDLFAGALIKQSVRRVVLDDQGRVTGETELRFGARVRDVRQGPDGLLYILTDQDAGRLIRLKPIAGGDTAP